jgi:drug/metabolite transporter (DMT)-like permease
MEYLWVILAFLAAIIQTSRNGMMKHLKGKLNDESIMFARIFFSVPFVCLWLTGFVYLGYALPKINNHFMLYVLLASILQIAGGMLFLKLFGRRNFVIGVTYSRLDSMMKVLFAALLFQEFVSLGALFGILLSFVGIVLITVAEENIKPKTLLERIFSPSAMIGMLCGTCFGATGILIRQAILELEGGEFFVNATYCLLTMLIIQSLIMLLIICYKNINQLTYIFKQGKIPYLVGVSNSFSAMGWYVALSLTHAAHVSMIGQIEIVFSMFLTHNVFKEKISRLECLAIAIVVIGIVMVILLH